MPVTARVEDDLAGQPAAAALVAEAARDAHGDPTAAGSMTHAWLITGPPGSGRSNLAYAFATALLSPDGRPDPQVRQQVAARTHPDLAVLATDNPIIRIDDVRSLVTAAAYSPSVAHYRVLVVEDADRMTERTSNVLLKALEEPPPRTVWILCAPSEADLLPTIRSRVRTVRLRVPTAEAVARLLETRDGVDADTALRAATEAQSHIGMARRLATNADARARRDETVRVALGTRTISQAVRGAARLLEIAKEDSGAMSEERDDDERRSTLRSLGVAEGQAVPAQLRSQLKHLEDEQKRRSTRSLRDSIDRVLVDLLSVFRDVLVLQLHAEQPAVNAAHAEAVGRLAAETDPVATLAALDAVQEARRRLPANVTPLLALEGMLVSLVLARGGSDA